MSHQLLSIKARTMKTKLRKTIRTFTFVCITLISTSCHPSCEDYCIPPEGAVDICDLEGGTYNYDKCKCEQ